MSAVRTESMSLVVGAPLRDVSKTARQGDGLPRPNIPGELVEMIDEHVMKQIPTAVRNTRYVNELQLSPDGTMLASTELYAQNVQLWNLTPGEPFRLITPSENVLYFCFSPNGRTFVAACTNGFVRVWDVATADETAAFRAPEYDLVYHCDFSPDGNTIALACGYGVVSLYDIGANTQRHVRGSHAGAVYQCVFNPSGDILASAGLDGDVKLWDPNTGVELAVLRSHARHVKKLVFSCDGGMLASAGTGCDVNIWNIKTRSLLVTVRASHQTIKKVENITFSPDGRTLVTLTAEEAVESWDVADGKRRASFIPPSVQHRVVGLGFSPDGRPLAVTTNNLHFMQVWDVNTNQERAVYGGHTAPLCSTTFSKDGRTLVTGSFDFTVRVWKL